MFDTNQSYITHVLQFAQKGSEIFGLGSSILTRR
jgi:hypothetical protein